MRKLMAQIVTLALFFVCSVVGASAADYTFKEKDNTDYYRSTLYEDMYGSTYNYGGQNVTDFYDPLALPGLVSPTPQTAATSGGLTLGTATYGAESYGIYDASASYTYDFKLYNTPWEAAFTSVKELRRSDGSIGTLSIPKLSINMKAYEGTGAESMNKGVGHFPESSGWNGNVALCGHNRGSTYAIGAIKDLKIGDTVKYTTLLGTRTYAVTFVGTISSNDWSYLAATSDNRITLITCLADQPSLRVVVQAAQIK